MTLSVQKMVKHTLKILQHLLQYFYSVLGYNANTKHLTRSQYVSFGCRSFPCFDEELIVLIQKV